jgi:hypothetical protein
MKRSSLRAWALIPALIATPWALYAAPAADAGTVLRVNEWRLSAASMDLLYRAAKLQDPQATRQAVAEAAAQDHLLGGYAQAQFRDEQLFVGARVGFALEAAAEASLVATLERVYQPALDQAFGAEGPQRFVVKRHALDMGTLRSQLGDGSVARLDDQLAAGGEDALARVSLLDYRFGNGPLQQVTLRDVWRQLDVHGRQALARQDAEFVHHQALRLVRASFVRHWATSQGGLQAADLQVLRQLMVDRERRFALEQAMGASGDLHGQSVELANLRQQVTQADVARYYAQHPEQFQRTERVLARHIRCKDEASAEAAYAELAQGQSFADVARRHSVAASAMKGGALGWVDAQQAPSRWLAQVLFAQPPGAASRPIREPESAGRSPGWQIVQVDERVQGLHPADSETVRFIATEAIAKARAIERYTALKDQLLRDARIAQN